MGETTNAVFGLRIAAAKACIFSTIMPHPPLFRAGHGTYFGHRRCDLPVHRPRSQHVTKFLHTMIRVTDPDATISFFNLLGLHETRRFSSEQGRFTLIYLACPGESVEVELTHNWPDEDGSFETYGGGRNFGHIALQVEDIYATCQTLADAGITINRPPRDGHMAFVKTPDGISVELLQNGHLPPQEPWASMTNTGSW